MAPRKNKINRNPTAEAVAKAIIENYISSTIEEKGVSKIISYEKAHSLTS